MNDTPNQKPNRQQTYHRNLTVSFFSILDSQWRRVRADLISDAELSTMNDTQRARIARMAEAARAIHGDDNGPADPHCESDSQDYQSRLPSARRAPLDITSPGSGITAYTYLGDKDLW